MSNPLAMQLLRQSLGSGNYDGGCCGSALLGGATRRKAKPILDITYTKPLSAQTEQKYKEALANPKGMIGNMKASQYAALHSPEARRKASVTRLNNKNAVNLLYNDRLESKNPMSKLEYCMTKCQIANDHRKEVAKISSQKQKIKKAIYSGVAPVSSSVGSAPPDIASLISSYVQ